MYIPFDDDLHLFAYFKSSYIYVCMLVLTTYYYVLLFFKLLYLRPKPEQILSPQVSSTFWLTNQRLVVIGDSPEDICKHYRWLPLGFRVSRRFGVLVRSNLCRFSGEVDGFLAASCFLAPRSYRQQELIHSSFDQVSAPIARWAERTSRM